MPETRKLLCKADYLHITLGYQFVEKNLHYCIIITAPKWYKQHI